jgi:hypothetical protein
MRWQLHHIGKDGTMVKLMEKQIAEMALATMLLVALTCQMTTAVVTN